ncbi:hypothetical protein [Nonomuraea fuscirosea]|uniref:hypothetical protein n=1 Tax=Nonomuraea fuscirosea TaxID=1291556 RepID=UPI001C625F74|nr:hypothetical protein [Nonomuraea fuscirosea]
MREHTLAQCWEPDLRKVSDRLSLGLDSARKCEVLPLQGIGGMSLADSQRHSHGRAGRYAPNQDS